MNRTPDPEVQVSPEPELPSYAGIAIDNVHLVDSVEEASLAVNALLAADVIGFDTESKPTFSKGEESTGPHLIQLATESTVYLFQIKQNHARHVLDAVKTILEDERILKVGFGLDSDTARLKTRLGITLTNVLDLSRVLPRSKKWETMGAKTAVAQYFRQRLQKSKRISTSNWAVPRLNERQMRYAADDAQVALKVYRRAFPTAANSPNPSAENSG